MMQGVAMGLPLRLLTPQNDCSEGMVHLEGALMQGQCVWVCDMENCLWSLKQVCRQSVVVLEYSRWRWGLLGGVHGVVVALG